MQRDGNTEMTSNNNTAKIDAAASDINSRWIDEMERRATARAPPHAHVYRADTFVPEGHLVPDPDVVYDTVEKTGARKFCVDKFAQWAEDLSGERFVSCDQGATQYIYKDGVYADGMVGWFKTAMNLCNRNSDVSIHYTREVINRLGANTMIDAGVIDGQDTNLTVLDNCILDTKTGEISDHTPDHITFSKLSCSYVEGATCPEWVEFLNYALPASEIETLQELFGYTLVRGYPYHTMFNLLGAGGNGKGTAMRMLRAMLGKGSCSAVALQDVGERFFAADLYGKFAQISGDTSPKALADTSVQKMLTGEDDVRIERKGKDAFDFVNHAKVISLMNELMKTDDQSDGFFRRFVLIRFDQTPTPQRIKEKEGFENRIIDNEMPGVLNWAIEGLRRLRERGGFRMTVEMTNDERRGLWNREAEPLQAFIETCCVRGPEYLVSTQVFNYAYNTWHEGRYGRPAKGKKGDITTNLEKFGVHRESKKATGEQIEMWGGLTERGNYPSVPIYRGVCLKNTPGDLSVDINYASMSWNEITGGDK